MVDYVNRWTKRTELPARKLLGWLELATSKYHAVARALRSAQRAQRPHAARRLAGGLGEAGDLGLSRPPSAGRLSPLGVHDARRRCRGRQPVERLSGAQTGRPARPKVAKTFEKRDGIRATAASARALARRCVVPQPGRHVLLPVLATRRLQPQHRPLGDSREHDRA